MYSKTHRPGMNAMDLYGIAVKDYFGGNKEAQIIVTRDDGYKDVLPVNVFFCSAIKFELDRVALKHCRGKILDIGAGAGRHALYLQRQGYDVTALDISSGACEVMQSRGVSQVLCENIWNWDSESKFDTLLILGRSIGLVESLQGFERFLEIAKKIISPDGQILLNSLDVRRTDDKRNLDYLSRNTAEGRYFGEIRMRFEYAGRISEFTEYLHIDPEILRRIAEKKKWDVKLLYTDEEGNYLSNLSLKVP